MERILSLYLNFRSKSDKALVARGRTVMDAYPKSKYFTGQLALFDKVKLLFEDFDKWVLPDDDQSRNSRKIAAEKRALFEPSFVELGMFTQAVGFNDIEALGSSGYEVNDGKRKPSANPGVPVNIICSPTGVENQLKLTFNRVGSTEFFEARVAIAGQPWKWYGSRSETTILINNIATDAKLVVNVRSFGTRKRQSAWSADYFGFVPSQSSASAPPEDEMMT